MDGTIVSGDVLRLRVSPDPVLRVVARPFDVFDDRLARLVDEMFPVMFQARGIGLAAPQVGVSRRLFVGWLDDRPLVVVNPVLLEVDGAQYGEEGCLSLPGLWVDRMRPQRVLLGGCALDGAPRQWELSGLGARLACHEIDHLDGRLLDDRLLDDRVDGVDADSAV